jgi:hypothetical protein
MSTEMIRGSHTNAATDDIAIGTRVMLADACLFSNSPEREKLNFELIVRCFDHECWFPFLPCTVRLIQAMTNIKEYNEEQDLPRTRDLCSSSLSESLQKIPRCAGLLSASLASICSCWRRRKIEIINVPCKKNKQKKKQHKDIERFEFEKGNCQTKIPIFNSFYTETRDDVSDLNLKKKKVSKNQSEESFLDRIGVSCGLANLANCRQNGCKHSEAEFNRHNVIPKMFCRLEDSIQCNTDYNGQHDPKYCQQLHLRSYKTKTKHCELHTKAQ